LKLAFSDVASLLCLDTGFSCCPDSATYYPYCW
jgi:hypothetical protein